MKAARPCARLVLWKSREDEIEKTYLILSAFQCTNRHKAKPPVNIFAKAQKYLPLARFMTMNAVREDASGGPQERDSFKKKNNLCLTILILLIIAFYL